MDDRHPHVTRRSAPPPPPQPQPQQPKPFSGKVALFLYANCENSFMLSNMAVDSVPGAAMRRRQRRLRQFLRHERLTVAMALAEAQHHAAPRRQKPASAITVNDAPRGQKNADDEYFELSSEEEVASVGGGYGRLRSGSPGRRSGCSGTPRSR